MLSRFKSQSPFTVLTSNLSLLCTVFPLALLVDFYDLVFFTAAAAAAAEALEGCKDTLFYFSGESQTSKCQNRDRDVVKYP